MHSIIKLKLWKKCIKRFGKKKIKQGDSSCSKSDHVKECVSVPESDTSKKKSSFEQLSLYSIDSLEERHFLLRKYGSKKRYNQKFTKKSTSLDSIITDSIRSDISDDSLQRWSLSKDSLCLQMKECIKDMNDSAERIKIKGSNNLLLSKNQTRDRSQTVGQSYQLEKLFNKSGLKFFADNQLHNDSKISSSNEVRKQLRQQCLSIDSLENSTGKLHTLNKQFISEDSLNEGKTEYFNKFSNTYRKKSISDGILHEAQYFQHLLHNRDLVILERILSSETNENFNVANKLTKYNNDQPKLISLIELKSLENYESEEEKLSIDSLSVPQSETLMNSSSEITELSIKRNKLFSPSASSHENSVIQYPGKMNDLQIFKMQQSNSHGPETHQYYCYTTNDKGYRKYHSNSTDLQKSSNTNSYLYNSMHLKEIGKEDTFSIDSLCDSLN